MKKLGVHHIHHVPEWPSYFCKIWALYVSQIYKVYIFTCLFSVRNTINLSHHELNMFNHAQWWKKYLSKEYLAINIIKHTFHVINLLYIYIYNMNIYIYIWKRNMKSFSNETVSFFFRKFCFSYILDFAKTVWALRILAQKFTRNFLKKEFWALHNHVLVSILLCSSHFTELN